MRSLIFEGYIRGVEGGEGISGKGREGVFIFDTNMMDKRRFSFVGVGKYRNYLCQIYQNSEIQDYYGFISSL